MCAEMRKYRAFLALKGMADAMLPSSLQVAVDIT